MSASKNPGSVEQQGEFSSRVAPSKPLETGGHKPGILASEADAAPTFSAEAHPPGTAPSNATHTPNPDINNQKLYQSASSTLQGASSADVHTGLGHPGQGQTSRDLRHDGSKGTGLGGLTNKDESSVTGKDPQFAAQRNLAEDVPTGQRGNVGGPAAQEREPVGAETVAAEAPRDR